MIGKQADQCTESEQTCYTGLLKRRKALTCSRKEFGMESTMQKVRSKDGTSIEYAEVGLGPVLVLVTGALGRGPDFAELAQRLALHFNVVSYDRRGRGNSGDT